MSIAVENKLPASRTDWLRSPLVLLAGAFILVLIFLGLPLKAPIGPMYWDSYLYYDAANRIAGGQVPIVDFFAPVGPLGYYIFAGWLAVFPDAQTSLITHWALLILTAPLMALIVAHVDRRSRADAWALLIPFLVFALLPFNSQEFYPFPSSDAFGIYNRQVCQMLYVLVAALLYVRNQRLLAFLVAACVTALFFLKITGFIAAGLICLFALVTGRITLRYAITAALAFAAVLAALELKDGMVSAYIADIEALVATNSGTLAPRLVQSISINVGVIASSLALCAVMAFASVADLGRRFDALRRAPGTATVAALLDRDFLWLGVAVCAGIFFEAQNTGSQAFIFLWPVLWMMLVRLPRMLGRPKLAMLAAALVAAVWLPLFAGTIERAIRTYGSMTNGVDVETHNLKALGSFTTRDNVLHRAELMLQLYPRQQQQLAEIAEGKELPSSLLYSDLDFQVTNLLAIDRGVDSIRALEAKSGVHFGTIMTLAFANPFPYLMDRSAPRLIAIGADPFRAVPEPDAEVLKEVAGTDLALYPKCPGTWANVRLLEIYGPGLKDHRRIALDDCWDAFVNPRFAGKLGG